MEKTPGTIAVRSRKLAYTPAVAVLCGLLLALLVALLVLPAREAQGAATVPPGFTDTQVAAGLNGPTTMALAPDGRIFVAEQSGRLRVIKNGQLLPTPFQNLSGTVDPRGERGLLGIAFDPNFASNNYIYLYYTQKAANGVPAHNRVVRVTANGDTVQPGSGMLLLRLNNLSTAQNHNGGALTFRGDGRLYVAVGDNARPENAQSLGNLLGKVLRINKNGSVPIDNPFYNRANGMNRAIWALGLRNPYTFAVQPGTGRFYINDVGQKTWEEINPGAAGANYGWPVYEGPETASRYVPPVFAYRHGIGPQTGCAITGGAFYNPSTATFPQEFVGDYFFADFCSGWIRRYDSATDQATDFATGAGRPVDLDVAPDGSLLYLDRETGSVNRIQAN